MYTHGTDSCSHHAGLIASTYRWVAMIDWLLDYDLFNALIYKNINDNRKYDLHKHHNNFKFHYQFQFGRTDPVNS